ncbi:PD-(D/E)XK nuclease family protein [Kurthia massiliensis]|uniref:PD-(D/E)XK nuclease family protein n=1 Tax=Kurthia massiliensis TaxID=1033739 RepID=UPI000287FC67|nr:PD-(D/E)XK nuclease family protein [Kurthia massiliensis]
MFEVKPFPEFSWSLSRSKSLLTCARRYGYDYYVSHNGWLSFNVSPEAQHAYRLKKLKHLPMFVGEIVHDAIEKTIGQIYLDRPLPTAETLVNYARHQLNTAYQTPYEAWHAKPNKHAMYFDRYYNGKLSAEQVATYQQRLPQLFEHFLTSETVTQLLAHRDTIRIQQAEQFRYVYINDVKVFIVMDLLYEDTTTNQWVIVDWKTGKASGADRQQLALYAYYLQQTLDIPLDRIVVRNEYLLEGKHITTTITQTDIEDVLAIFERSVFDMRQYQADMFTNEPYEIDTFPRTTHEKTCETCNYREMCLPLNDERSGE